MEMKNTEEMYQERLARHIDEIKWLYMELYDNEAMLQELLQQMHVFYEQRGIALRGSDERRESNPAWYKGNEMLGMMLYIENFAGTLRGVRDKIGYLRESNVNYIHLMPFLDTPEGRSDGGYAVSDFRKVREDLGTIEDLRDLAEACHEQGINLCMDFVMNHTSEDHEWAVKARQGDGEYMSRYFFFDHYDIPAQYEQTVPQVFPTTAPGNFTWCEEVRHYVMTTFYPYQWDLNYKNPRVFNEMMYNFLFLANCGIDIMRIDAVPYIWKELGTSCRNLPKVHTIVRIMRMISEVVCPGVLLLGEVVMEPRKVVPYFGTLEKPECHMLYNVTTMATTWHTVATRDTRLLKRQLDIVNDLPKDYVFLNYLRCHDDIGWGLDYETLKTEGFEEIPHKRYLNNYFLGLDGYSDSRGRLYNDDPVTQDARMCATTASLCGLEQALKEEDEEKITESVNMILTLHAFMFLLSGIPVIYSGDEIGQLNDYSYEQDPKKADDSRYVHRGAFQWEQASLRTDPDTPQGRIFQEISRMETIRRTEELFRSEAAVWTIDTGEKELLSIGRYLNKEKLIGIFNFSERAKVAHYSEDGLFTDLMTSKIQALEEPEIPAHSFVWLKKTF
ncbi:MAG: alpha-amylase family protein [Parasporobacterium sp.]|nr:alpha-amylase family protein [Parasporobacterium sp.]